MEKRKIVVTGFSLTGDLIERLDRKAQEEERSRSFIARRAFGEYLDRSENREGKQNEIEKSEK